MSAVSVKRNSSLELLRIIAILFIIISHYSAHGAASVVGVEFSLNRFITSITNVGNLGAVIFVIISGYFLINSTFKVKKAVQLITQVLFYSIVLFILSVVFGARELSISNIITALFPATMSLYWFFTAYILLYIFSPFINKMLNSISRSSHFKMNIIMLICWSVIPTVTNINLMSNELTQFFMFYSIGAYLRKYPDNVVNKNKNRFIILTACALTLVLSSVVLIKISEYMGADKDYSTYFYYRHSIFVIGIAVSLVASFAKIKPFSSKVINTISSCVFGIYLIHDNRFFRYFMWLEIFDTDKYAATNYMLLHIIACAVIIFAVGCVIELTRKNLIEKPAMKLYDKIAEKTKTRCS